MWMAVIAATLLSLIGFNSLLVEAAVPSSRENAMAEWQATDMAAYRFAVVSFANVPANAGFVGTVPRTSLSFPLGYIPPPTAMWTNDIQADGTILIYAAIDPPVSGLTAAINRQVSSSPMLVQPYVTASASSSAPNGTVDALTPLARSVMSGKSTAIQHVPVWLAHRG